MSEKDKTDIPQEIEEARAEISAKMPSLGGQDWAKTLCSVEPLDAVAMLVEQCAKLHDAALRGDRWWRDAKTGALRYEARPDFGSALDALRTVAQVTAVKRSAADITKEGRRWAAMTPEERAAETLKDPLHGPILRELVKRESEEDER